MSSNKDFLPSSSPISSICTIEIEAILFLFMMNCYKSSFQECITIIVLKIERTTNQPPYCLLQLQEKKRAFRLPRSGCLGTPLTLPQSLYGRTDERTYADVRTKVFWINGLPNLFTHGAPRALLIIIMYYSHNPTNCHLSHYSVPSASLSTHEQQAQGALTSNIYT